MWKLKYLNLGTYIPDWRILELEFESIIALFEINALEFV